MTRMRRSENHFNIRHLAVQTLQLTVCEPTGRELASWRVSADASDRPGHTSVNNEANVIKDNEIHLRELCKRLDARQLEAEAQTRAQRKALHIREHSQDEEERVSDMATAMLDGDKALPHRGSVRVTDRHWQLISYVEMCTGWLGGNLLLCEDIAADIRADCSAGGMAVDCSPEFIRTALTRSENLRTLAALREIQQQDGR